MYFPNQPLMVFLEIALPKVFSETASLFKAGPLTVISEDCILVTNMCYKKHQWLLLYI